MQYIGTDLFRDALHPNTHVNALFSELRPDSKFIITDVRFINEADAILNSGGIVIRLNRKLEERFPELWKVYLDQKKGDYTTEDDFCLYLINQLNPDIREFGKSLVHTSEIDLDRYQKFSAIVDNNSTIEDLHNTVKDCIKLFSIS